MGDFYRRDGNRRPPKRRYRDDDEDGDYNRRGDRYGRDDPLNRLKRETIKIAESALVKIEDSIQQLADGFVKNFDDEEFRAGYLAVLHDLVVEQPFKIPFVATIVRIANVANEAVGKATIDHFGAELHRYWKGGAFTQFKLILRFFTCLGDMVGADGVYPILEQLWTKLETYNTEGNEGLVLAIVYMILITLPYAAVSGSEKFSNETITEILGKVEKYADVKHPLQTLLDPFSGNQPPYNEPRAQGVHMVSVLFQNIQLSITEEPANDWSGTNCLPTPWKDMITTGTAQTLPTLELPEDFPLDKSTIFPEYYFSVFADQPFKTVPSCMDLSNAIFRDAIVDTINLLDCNRLTVSRYLIELDCFYNPRSFIRRATPYDRVNDAAAAGTSTWKPEDIAVDAIFSQLFRLPTPQHKLVYYHSILTELCKLQPAAIAPSLGRAIRFMYRNLEIIDTELIYRFVDWFSHHLSNFGYTWKWAEWSEHLNFPDVHPKKAFVLGSLEKEIRLSFATRIKGTLPDPFKELIPEEREKEQPVFKFDLPDNPLADVGKDLLTVVAERKPEPEVKEAFEKVALAAQERGLIDDSDPGAVTRDAYVTVICHIGAKSLSHVLSCIERTKETLLALGTEHPDARRQIVASVLSYWKDQPGIGANVVDKLLNYSIISPISVVEYVLSDAGPEALSRVHAWEMVATTINKVNNRLKQILAAKDSVLGAEGVLPEQIAVFEETLKGAREEQEAILKLVTERLGKLASSEEDEGEGDVESRAWVMWWAKGWLKAFRRKFGVKDEADVVMENDDEVAV